MLKYNSHSEPCWTQLLFAIEEEQHYGSSRTSERSVPIVEPRWAREAYRRGTPILLRYGTPILQQLRRLKVICCRNLERLRSRLERGLAHYWTRLPFHDEEPAAIAAIARRLNRINVRIIQAEIRSYAVLDALSDIRHGTQPVRHVVMVGQP